MGARIGMDESGKRMSEEGDQGRGEGRGVQSRVRRKGVE